MLPVEFRDTEVTGILRLQAVKLVTGHDATLTLYRPASTRMLGSIHTLADLY
jgi:hypothetical protein